MIKFEESFAHWSADLNQEKWQHSLKKSLQAPFCDFALLSLSCEGAKKRAAEIRASSEQTVVVGIGGSYWTPHSLNTYFSQPDRYRLFFLDSPETKSFHQLFYKISDFEKTHFVFISKSGSTLEPLSLLSSLIKYASDKGVNLAERSTLLCSPGDHPMSLWAKREEVPTLEIPSEIGGRFSSLTTVGTLAVELLGFDCVDFLSGAKASVENRELIDGLGTFFLRSFSEGYPITQLWTYSASLWPVGQWWQQLLSESLAKQGGPRVGTPMVCSGPRDQHSLLQQLMEGERDKTVLLLQDESLIHEDIFVGDTFSDREELQSSGLKLSDVLHSEIEGFCGALKERHIPLSRMSGDFSHIQTWGEFFMAWQVVIASMGFYLGVNPFDQPGVELGKDLARRYLKSVVSKEG